MVLPWRNVFTHRSASLLPRVRRKCTRSLLLSTFPAAKRTSLLTFNEPVGLMVQRDPWGHSGGFSSIDGHGDACSHPGE